MLGGGTFGTQKRGTGVEGALVHVLNHVWPNSFETSPHVVNTVISAIQGCAESLGPAVILDYVLQGLFSFLHGREEMYTGVYTTRCIYISYMRLWLPTRISTRPTSTPVMKKYKSSCIAVKNHTLSFEYAYISILLLIKY